MKSSSFHCLSLAWVYLLVAADAHAQGTTPEGPVPTESARAEPDASTNPNDAAAKPSAVESRGERTDPEPPPPIEPQQMLADPSEAAAQPIEVAPIADGASAPSEQPVEVTIRGGRSNAVRLLRSAEAVNVIDTRRAKQQSADLGEVLARAQGISVRREGGLGSSARFSLNGLQNEQIRFFLDGVPLDVAGYPFGVANVPVNLIERVEVYRGVVPIRFGADALGGALNLVTDTRYETHLSASYQVGSFGTHRATANGRYRHDKTGFVVGASAFVDEADNDYRVDVIGDATGQPVPANVRRFHDGYRAFGGSVEAGIVDRTWAKRLLLRGYATTYDKELQHNIVMAYPYGAVENGETVYGVNARYDVDFGHKLKLESIASYAHRAIDYIDKAPWIYDWFGRRTPKRAPGEVTSQATEQTIWQNTAFARLVLSWEVAPRQLLRASITPMYVSRTGQERFALPSERDPLSAERRMFTFVSGLEYELNLLAERVSNILFVKDYVYWSKSEEALPGGVFTRADHTSHKQGVGDALRVRIAPWLFIKASYEYATRLPSSDEVFGNGVFIGENLRLQPEVSHNGNFGPRVELGKAAVGQLTVDVNAFLRKSDKLIVLLGDDPSFSYQNVYKSRGAGVESGLAWVSPGRWVALDGSLTWQDIRNVSNRGTFAMFEGDRIPNRPWLFASWGARLRFANLPAFDDALEPYYIGRYVHSFHRLWQTNSADYLVGTQVSHNLGLTYVFAARWLRTSTTFEVSNVSDAKVFDNFGVQKPGRAYYFKLTGEL
jgi:vitamin B12 transporter